MISRATPGGYFHGVAANASAGLLDIDHDSPGLGVRTSAPDRVTSGAGEGSAALSARQSRGMAVGENCRHDCSFGSWFAGRIRVLDLRAPYGSLRRFGGSAIASVR
jgi:hypothetical protein